MIMTRDHLYRILMTIICLNYSNNIQAVSLTRSSEIIFHLSQRGLGRMLSTSTTSITDTVFWCGRISNSKGIRFKDNNYISLDSSQAVNSCDVNEEIAKENSIKSIRQVLNVVNHLSQVPFLKKHRTYANNTQHIEHETFGIFFRGDNCKKGQAYPLLPGIMRSNNRINEVSALKHIQALHPKITGNQSFLGQLSYAQHYGLPTRLLDFSTNILKALYFAVENAEEDDDKDASYGRLFILNAYALNNQSRLVDKGLCLESDYDAILRTSAAFFHNKGDLLCSDAVRKVADTMISDKINLSHFDEKFLLPVAIFPDVLHDRIRAQEGTFVVFGGINPLEIPEDSFARTILEEHCMCAIVKNRLHIKKELEQIGIHGASIYPELDSQMAYIKKVWRIR